MQHRVNVAREHRSDPIALLPSRAKPVGVVATAEEAWPVPGGERGGLVEKEQLGPAAAAHHLAPPSPEFADTGQPGRARPAARQQGLGGGVVNDAAVAGEHPAMWIGDDLSLWRDAVLQRHSLYIARGPRISYILRMMAVAVAVATILSSWNSSPLS